MLAAGQRLRRAGEFSAAMRAGGRASRGGLVVHVFTGSPAPGQRAGFIVPKAVGPAVTRNAVRRRLRHLLRDRLPQLPAGTDVVVRVLPAAADATYDRLGTDLDAALTAARSGRGRRNPAGGRDSGGRRRGTAHGGSDRR